MQPTKNLMNTVVFLILRLRFRLIDQLTDLGAGKNTLDLSLSIITHNISTQTVFSFEGHVAFFEQIIIFYLTLILIKFEILS